MKIEVVQGMSFEDYRAVPAINQSGLGALSRSPAHYFAENLDPMREPRAETPAMRLGSAIHTATLEPSEFLVRYAIMPDDLDRRTKEGKTKYAELELTGKKILSASEAHAAARVSAKVRAHPSASAIFERGSAEQSFFWQDAEMGVQCKARLDWVSPDASIIVDLKSTEDASYDAFQRSCMTYGYYRQAAWYCDAVMAVTRRDLEFLFAAFEKNPPYECAFYNADEEMLAAGREENRALLRVYAECLKTNTWPGYPEEIRPIGLPSWFLLKRQMQQPAIREVY